MLQVIFFHSKLLIKFENNLEKDPVLYYIYIFLAGFFIGGPFNQISSAVVTDIVKIIVFLMLYKLNYNIGQKLKG